MKHPRMSRQMSESVCAGAERAAGPSTGPSASSGRLSRRPFQEAVRLEPSAGRRKTGRGSRCRLARARTGSAYGPGWPSLARRRVPASPNPCVPVCDLEPGGQRGNLRRALGGEEGGRELQRSQTEALGGEERAHVVRRHLLPGRGFRPGYVPDLGEESPCKRAPTPCLRRA